MSKPAKQQQQQEAKHTVTKYLLLRICLYVAIANVIIYATALGNVALSRKFLSSKHHYSIKFCVLKRSQRVK